MSKITETSTEKLVKVCCTWQDDADCENCSNNEKIDCKWKSSLLLRFMFVMTPGLLLAFVGVIVGAVYTQAWWRLGALIGYFALFFIVETRILCSHCPYYSKEGLMLHCLANHGFLKIFKYHPEPMNWFEKTLLVIGFILFGSLPALAQIYSVVIVARNQGTFSSAALISLAVLLGVTCISIVIAFSLLFSRICPKCVNFSCPFNSTPKECVDEYLKRNPVMREAWEKKGYVIDE
ncbi:MAG: hypothetical protein FK733_00910 [Asgard group archaeon]|nr:hypothetical protein [Asgard group archaeon]